MPCNLFDFMSPKCSAVIQALGVNKVSDILCIVILVCKQCKQPLCHQSAEYFHLLYIIHQLYTIYPTPCFSSAGDSSVRVQLPSECRTGERASQSASLAAKHMAECAPQPQQGPSEQKQRSILSRCSVLIFCTGPCMWPVNQKDKSGLGLRSFLQFGGV